MKKFDGDKYLKKLKFKRAWRNYERYFYIGVPCLMIVLLVASVIFNKKAILEDNKVYLDNAIGAYIDGEYSKTIPGKNDGYVVKNIVCDNGAVGEWNDDKWGLLTTNMTQKSKCNIYFETKKTSVVEAINVAMSTDSSMFATDDPDSNVRYIGANPNNYVYFNCSDYNNQSDSTCEKWRIIGVFNNVTKSDGTKENLVKIIRDESIGNYSWDNKDTTTGAETANGKNDWVTARLNYLLNPGHDSESIGGSLYYNAKSGTCYFGENNATTSCDFTSTGLKNDTTRNAIESVVWNLGGVSSSSSPVSTFYTGERGTTVYSGRPTTWTGKIGLMYPSDYGYAVAGARAACLSTNLNKWRVGGLLINDCPRSDYLYKSNYVQWTLAPYLGDADGVFSVNSSAADSGGDVEILNANATHNSIGFIPTILGVRPALYLKSSISVVDGNGTSTSPYKLEM